MRKLSEINFWRARDPKQTCHWQWHTVYFCIIPRVLQHLWLHPCDNYSMLSASQWLHRENRTECEEPPPEMQGIWCRSSSRHVMSPQHPTWPQHRITSRAPELQSIPSKPPFHIQTWFVIICRWRGKQPALSTTDHNLTSLPRPFLPYILMRVLNPHDHKWHPGIVKGSMQAPCSCMVTMTNGSTHRWTCSHIRPTGENICIQNIRSDEPPAPPYEVCSTMPSISRDSCEPIALACYAPASTPHLRCPTVTVTKYSSNK